jgi:hypothetical protein
LWGISDGQSETFHIKSPPETASPRKPIARMNGAFTPITSVSKTEPVIKPLAQPTTAPPALRPKPPAATPVNGRGKPSQYWLHDEDRRALRSLAAWLAAQGERPTDSLVIRSVLQMATAGPKLLKAYRQAAQLDGRLKATRNAPGSASSKKAKVKNATDGSHRRGGKSRPYAPSPHPSSKPVGPLPVS